MKLSIDHNSPIPLHAQVESLLRDLVKEQEYIEGKALPKEVELSKLLGVARNTVRQATNKLVYENLITRKKGKGTYVNKPTLQTKLQNWTSFTEEMLLHGIKVKNYMIHSGMKSADKEIAAELGINENTEVVELIRLRGDDEGPSVLFYSYFHPRLGISKEEDFNQPLYTTLEEKYFTRATTSKEEISAILAEGKIASHLRVTEGMPILKRKRIVLDPGNRIIEYNFGYYRSDKFKYSIDIHRS